MQVDYASIDPRIESLIRNIEAKPHVLYIRYLLSKKQSPSFIKQELRKASLSAPHEEALTKYYLAVMDPVIKELKLTKVYAEYKKKLTMKNSKRAPGAFTQDLINYKLVFSEEVDLQPAFSKFVKYMEIDPLWTPEILRYHGTVDNLPVDEHGVRILSGDLKNLNYEKVLMCPRRHLIDKMLLEHISDVRISDYLVKTAGIRNISPGDIRGYRQVFFNIRVVTTEEIIHTLESERDAIQQFLSDMENNISANDMTVSDRVNTTQRSQARLDELEDSIRDMQATYSDAVADVAYMDAVSIRGIFNDVLKRGYNRFIHLDKDLTRDAVDPLLKVANMMGKAYEKMATIEASEAWQKSGDKSSQEAIIQLYKESFEQNTKTALVNANDRLAIGGHTQGLNPDLDYNDIDGIDELGVNFIQENTPTES